MLTASLRWLQDRLAPRRCAFCGVILAPVDKPVCDGCHDDLPWRAHFADVMLLHPNPFSAVVTPLEYRFPIDAAIKAFKFRRKFHYQPAFADILLAAAAALPHDIDAILPVPLHRQRRIVRRFNQAEELAGPLSRALGVEVIHSVRRIRHTPYQSGLSAAARRQNLRSAFDVCGRLQAEHVLIVDDVITTGETCRQLARLLLANGVDRVSVLALARATATD